MPLPRVVILLFLSLVFVLRALAQSMPTMNVVNRMTIIESRGIYGTVFSVDVDNREYWITAKHVLTGAKHPPYGTISDKLRSVRLLDTRSREERWSTVDMSVIDTGNDIDIVVLAPAKPQLQNPLPSVRATFEGVMLGADCEFLGYPSATKGVWSANGPDGKFQWMPFVKHCFLSSFEEQVTKAVMLDGFNNLGFSGGPVIYRTGRDQQIIAVISGIVTEPAEVIPSVATKKSTQRSLQSRKGKVDANSGFVVAYSIDAAINAIRKNPQGALR
jgi:hypothetical protein